MPRDNDNSQPENHGKPWSYTDENLLLKKMADGENIKDISKHFKRTEGGIRSRLRDLACRFVDEGKTIEEASKFTHTSIEDIEKSLALRKAAVIAKQTPKKEETILSVVIEIRDLLKELLKKDSNSDDDVQTVTTVSTYGLS